MAPEISPIVFDILAGATALGALIQAGVLLGMLLGFRKLQKKIEKILDPMMEHAIPLIATSKATLEELSPKLKTITNNLADVSETLKHESRNIRGSMDDVLEKTKAQTARVDEMVSGTLDGISNAGAAIQQGLEAPMRKLHGLLSGLRAGLSVLRSKEHEGRVEPVTEVPKVDEVILIVEEVISGRPGT